MSIKREDWDAGRIDLGDVVTGKRLPLIHPGEILRDDFLEPMKISVYTLAQAIRVPRLRVNGIVLGRRGITAGRALTCPRRSVMMACRFDEESVSNRTGSRNPLSSNCLRLRLSMPSMSEFGFLGA